MLIAMIAIFISMVRRMMLIWVSPGSRGCVRMCNKDVIELFNLVNVGDRVTICDV